MATRKVNRRTRRITRKQKKSKTLRSSRRTNVKRTRKNGGSQPSWRKRTKRKIAKGFNKVKKKLSKIIGRKQTTYNEPLLSNRTKSYSQSDLPIKILSDPEYQFSDDSDNTAPKSQESQDESKNKTLAKKLLKDMEKNKEDISVIFSSADKFVSDKTKNNAQIAVDMLNKTNKSKNYKTMISGWDFEPVDVPSLKADQQVPLLHGQVAVVITKNDSWSYVIVCPDLKPCENENKKYGYVPSAYLMTPNKFKASYLKRFDKKIENMRK